MFLKKQHRIHWFREEPLTSMKKQFTDRFFEEPKWLLSGIAVPPFGTLIFNRVSKESFLGLKKMRQSGPQMLRQCYGV